MMAALWSDVDADIGSALRHFGQAVRLFREERFSGIAPPGYLDEMAFLHAMQSGYTSFEAGMKRVLALIDEELPKGGDSHAALLGRLHQDLPGSRPAIIDDVLFGAADILRRFRHVAIHAYDHFDRARAALAVQAAETFLAGIEPAIARFRTVIDPD